MVTEVVPTAQRLHDLSERLVFEDKLTPCPAAHHLGVGGVECCRTVVLVVFCLVTGLERQLTALATHRFQGDTATDERRHHFVFGIGIDVKLGAEDLHLLTFRLDDERMVGIVSNLKVSLASGLDAPLLAVENCRILDARAGIEADLRAVGHRDAILTTPRRL